MPEAPEVDINDELNKYMEEAKSNRRGYLK